MILIFVGIQPDNQRSWPT